jgi:peptide/nickel transport system permease protein
MATKPNGRTLARKLAGPVSSFAVTVLAGGFLTATMVRFSPGFAADEQLLDTRLNEASRNAMRMRHEAEADMPRFYVRHLVNMLRGDLGFSYSMQRPVAELLADRLPVTARLIAMGMAGAWLLGLTLAAAVVLWPTSIGSGMANGITGMLLCLPPAVLALLLFYHDGPVRIVIALVLFPKIFQYVRNILSQARLQPHVLAAHAGGLRLDRIFLYHIVPFSLPQLLALAGVSVSMAFGAAIPIEVICDLPGVGQLAWKAALARDLPLLVNLTFLIVVITQLGNLLSDCAIAVVGRGSMNERQRA